MRYIRVFSSLSGSLRYSTQKRILVEVALIKLCKPEMETSYDAIIDRITHLEERMERGIPNAPRGIMCEAPETAAVPKVSSAVKKPPLPKAVPEDIKKAVTEWKTIVSDTDVLSIVQGFLRKAHLSVGGEGDSAKLLLVFDDHNAAGMCGDFTTYYCRRWI